MSIRPIAAGLLFTLIPWTVAADHETFSLYTFDSPPYQQANPIPGGPEVTGETVETVRCAMEHAGAQVNIRLMPQNRARFALQRQLVDGYFAVDPSPDMDEAADISHPVALEKWYWFYLGQRPDPTTAKIGVVGGSNEEVWLIQNGFEPFVTVSSTEQLPALLKRQRIDLALMDQQVMETLREDSLALGQTLNREFLRYAPLHLYLNRRFVSEHPGVLTRFNRQLPACMEQHMQLSADEYQHVAGQARGLIQDLEQRLNLAQAIHQGPVYDSFTEILTQDTLWQALAPEQPTPLASEILGLPASQALKQWQDEQGGLVTELLLTDNKGALVAMSQLSSDYWQGDEPKFQEIAVETERGMERKSDLWISPIRYDASTRQFQIIVSVPIPLKEPNNGLEGILAMGLAIEKALHNYERLARARSEHVPMELPVAE
ncbi:MULTISPECIES: substrate-binding periplasmic protein [Marinobacter]|uniref:substrate-binding periplasmic protein n=1 Tax=Marinobacter TaxID=2742 RepID=UPI0035BB6BCB